MAQEKKKVVDFNKMDTPILAELYLELGDKAKDFNPNDYVVSVAAKTAMVTTLDAEGKPETYYDKKGNLRVRKHKVAIGDTKKNDYNLLAAKRAFYYMFKDEFEWVNPPKEAAKKQKDDKKKKALAAMGVEL